MTRPPNYSQYGVTVYAGDCLDVLAELDDGSVHAVVTDPPYSLGFMGRDWDTHDEREDAGFAYWLAGFIDGEGCFRVQRHERGTFTCTFSIKVRRDERGTLEAIRRFLGGIGTIRDGEGTGNAHPQSTYAIQDKAGCARLVRVLDKYPLRAKKRLDYEPWAEAVVEWNTMRRGHRWSGRADWSRMEQLKARVEGARRYVDPPWSGHGYQDWCRLWARECLRVLKPGGHLLAFGGSRTWHRLACAVEDAGFEVRDSIAWLYASGFPKSLDVSKAIDKARDDRADVLAVGTWLRTAIDASGMTVREIGDVFGLNPRGVDLWAPRPTDKAARQRAHCPTWEQWQKLQELLGFGDEMDAEVWRLNGRKGTPGEAWSQREVVGERTTGRGTGRGDVGYISDGANRDITAPATDAARAWQGWGTALKPAFEPIVVARKPLAGTVAANVQEHGTGALNIDACRIQADDAPAGRVRHGGGTNGVYAQDEWTLANQAGMGQPMPPGRWPSNVVITHAATPDGEDLCADGCVPGCPVRELDEQAGVRTSGSRQAGAYGLMGYHGADVAPMPAVDGDSGGASRFFPVFRFEAKAPAAERPRVDGVAHPTVKPLALMRWLVRLVTPPGGTVLEPFLGSGTTAHAARAEGFQCIGIERDESYLPLIRFRLDGDGGPDLFATVAGEQP